MAVPWQKRPEFPTTNRLVQGVSTKAEPIHLLVDPDNPDGAARTFDTVEKQFGSANFSVFSMQKAVELDLVVHGLPGLVEDVRQEAQRRIDDSQRVESAADLKKYNRVLASL